MIFTILGGISRNVCSLEVSSFLLIIQHEVLLLNGDCLG